MNVIYDIIDMCLPFAWLEPTFMKNAFLAVLVAAPLFGGLGSFVVSNNMAFYSDAIGHSALTGIALGIILGIKNPILSMVVFSLLLGCAIITVKTKGKTSADTIIGVFSSAAVALGLVLLSATGNFAKYQKYLVGDILSIQPSEIALLLVVALLVIIIWTLFYNKMLLTNMHRTFAKSRGVSVFFIEQLFALTTALIVAVSIHWTGLLVINSLLVLPAAAARLVTRSSRSYVLTSVLISLLSSVIGLIISYYWDSVSGATIVLVNTVAFVVCLALGSLRKK
ncbi:MAG: metal ABC transporter permease [Candidatus Treponema excrementipullorum]|nr:metal ABC transporter permease [Spirochaetia bacterium]MCI6953907.1 metal ABC transporter permease [Spirochaetia bacterium]MDD7013125.1 metal ABC transporter permease [Candidatus Treponema excrementipullorum]MDY2756227.1 metal ABC transporter permease [Candidatus Treponema excrementipullorum]MDY4466246.1 metal ABC transporter permease [Candidatus Treponema excrementipullorum]